MGTILNKKQNGFWTADNGFTLIDIAIILLVVGLLAAPFIKLLNTQAKVADIRTTTGNFDNASAALRAYYFENRYYPCPADPTLGPDNPDFGAENREDDGDPSTLGECITDNLDDNYPNDTDTAMWGAIPHKALKLTFNQTLDAWNNKILYTVSTHQTMPATYNATGTITAIELKTLGPSGECIDNATPATFNNLHIMLSSSGKTGLGAYTLNGSLPRACAPSTGAQATRDSENCDRDNEFLLATCIQNTNTSEEFFDDLIIAGIEETWSRTPTKIWEESEDPEDMGSIIGHIGIGTKTPEHPIDVVGNIRATNNPEDDSKNGNVHASDYCDTSGEFCFDPQAIADYDSNMNCQDNAAMAGIGSNQAKCINTVPGGTQSQCRNNQYAIGLTAGGEVICQSL